MSARLHEITCQKAFRKLKRHIGPYMYDMNIYRGCAHQCSYCYAIYSQRYLEQDDFYHDIYYKGNIVEQLEKQLASPRWTKEIICLGTVCDSYQPVEKELGIMRDVLKLFIKYRNPIIISTKSDLLLRDIDLIKELSSLTFVNIAATITTMDETLASIVEPGAVSPARRATMLKRMKEETQASCGIHISPIMPYLNDDEASFTALLKTANLVGVDYVMSGMLNLIGDTRKSYFQMLHQHFPDLVKPYMQLYPNGRIQPAYKQSVYSRYIPLVKQYHINTDYMKGVRAFEQKKEVEQLSLW